MELSNTGNIKRRNKHEHIQSGSNYFSKQERTRLS